jgi:tetratricopeptide (TPR) repeat protein
MRFDARAYWDFDDPESSRSRFEKLLEGDYPVEVLGEIRCQIARSFGLQNQFDLGFEMLQRVVPVGRSEGCLMLEHGRLLRSSGKVEQSREWFENALLVNDEDLKIDALHMLALIETPEKAEQLNGEALMLSRSSNDPFAKRWQGSLLNNLAWTYFNTGRVGEALELFKEVVALREISGTSYQLHVAKWCVARCYRELQQSECAIEILNMLLQDDDDEYVFEELAENYAATMQWNHAKEYSQKTLNYVQDEARVSRMREILGHD